MKKIKRTDKGRLDCLQKLLFGNGVVCRWSESGRGWRLHQTTITDHKFYDRIVPVGKSIRKAIDNFLDAELEKPRAEQ